MWDLVLHSKKVALAGVTLSIMTRCFWWTPVTVTKYVFLPEQYDSNRNWIGMYPFDVRQAFVCSYSHRPLWFPKRGNQYGIRNNAFASFLYGKQSRDFSAMPRETFGILTHRCSAGARCVALPRLPPQCVLQQRHNAAHAGQSVNGDAIALSGSNLSSNYYDYGAELAPSEDIQFSSFVWSCSLRFGRTRFRNDTPTLFANMFVGSYLLNFYSSRVR